MPRTKFSGSMHSYSGTSAPTDTSVYTTCQFQNHAGGNDYVTLKTHKSWNGLISAPGKIEDGKSVTFYYIGESAALAYALGETRKLWWIVAWSSVNQSNKVLFHFSSIINYTLIKNLIFLLIFFCIIFIHHVHMRALAIRISYCRSILKSLQATLILIWMRSKINLTTRAHTAKPVTLGTRLRLKLMTIAALLQQ